MIFLTLLVLAAFQGSWAYELQLFQATFRHGHRAPKTSVYKSAYPNSPYANYTWYPEGSAGLTLEGKRREYNLGQWLRLRYDDDFLNDVYTSDVATIRTDDSTRTIMSAELVIAGLFPPTSEQTWNESLAWQPIPYSYKSTYEDCLYNAHWIVNEDYLDELMENNETIIELKAEYEDFFANITEKAGANASFDECYDIYSQLVAERNENLTLPDWVSEDWVGFENGTLYNVAAYHFVLANWDDELIKFYGGLWIKEFLTNADAYINGTSDQLAYLYSAHEGHVAAILIALDVFELHVPYFGSCVIFELYIEDEEYYVKVVYKNKDSVEELVIPGCDCEYCSLETFRSIFADILVDDVASSCTSAASS